MNIISIIKETYADGPGIRYSIYTAGCTHQCDGCHNPESWDFNSGEKLTEEYMLKIIEEIQSNPLITGITISGGDPFCNYEGLLYLLLRLKDLNKNIWVFTGYSFEDLIAKKNSIVLKCLEYIDVLVDGPYIKELRDTSQFKGSKNQRFILPKQSLKENKTIEL